MAAHLPGPRSREERAFTTVTWLALPLSLMLLIAGGIFGVGMWLNVAFALGVLLIIVAVAVTVHRDFRCRQTDALINHRMRVCTGCMYILDGLADSGLCPECARPYTAAELKEAWQETYPELAQR